MENNKDKGGFQYIYSAKEQAEIKRIRDKYTEREEGKLQRLRRLDRGATRKAQAFSLSIGVIGALLLGFGMSLIMTELGEILGENREIAMPLGITIGIIGGIVASLAHPAYNFILKRERKRIAPEIIRLSEELMK